MYKNNTEIEKLARKNKFFLCVNICTYSKMFHTMRISVCAAYFPGSLDIKGEVKIIYSLISLLQAN